MSSCLSRRSSMSIRDQTLAIAVIGVTGSGKSTFINLASGSNLPLSNSSGFCTTKLESSTFSLDGRSVTLIDTPGFDDTPPSVLNVLKLISDHFSGLHNQGAKLAGVIYMHCLSEDHVSNPSRHNFQVFRKFCGDSSLRDVVIVANKQPNDSDARAQDPPHKDEFFRPAVDKGARVLCHDGSQASAHAILRHLINRQHTDPLVREDGFDGKHTLPPTAATTGPDVTGNLAGQIERHTKEFGALCQGIDAAACAEDEGLRGTLREKAKDSLESIERIRHDLEQTVKTLAVENSRLENENRRYRQDFSEQKAEVDLRTRLLLEERKAREVAEAGRGRAELRLAEERALWERQQSEGSKGDARPQRYDKFLVGGALVLATICVSRFAFDGFTFSLL